MRKARRYNLVLNVEEVHELLNLTKQQVRALIANNEPDDFLYELTTHMPRVGRHAPQSSFTEAL